MAQSDCCSAQLEQCDVCKNLYCTECFEGCTCGEKAGGGDEEINWSDDEG